MKVEDLPRANELFLEIAELKTQIENLKDVDQIVFSVKSYPSKDLTIKLSSGWAPLCSFARKMTKQITELKEEELQLAIDDLEQL